MCMCLSISMSPFIFLCIIFPLLRIPIKTRANALRYLIQWITRFVLRRPIYFGSYYYFFHEFSRFVYESDSFNYSETVIIILFGDANRYS